MLEAEVGESEKREIQKQTDRILRDLGNPDPPLRLEEVRRVLSLDLKYYRSSDPGLIAELTHRFKLLAHKAIPDAGRHLLSALSKSKLVSFWVPESARILVDEDVPEPKQRWLEAHEIMHSVIPWHKHFLLGDNKQTLDPACHATLEAEANYGTGRLLFLQNRFAEEARDLSLTFDNIKSLAKRYQNSIVSTFWRMVEDRDPSLPVFGVISMHPIHPNIGSHDGPDPWRYYIRSPAFRVQFPAITVEEAYQLIRQHATGRKTGPVFSVTHTLQDVRGATWEFALESFSTSHALLTFGHALHRWEGSLVVPAEF